MKIISPSVLLTQHQISIIKTLIYFDVFSYPVTFMELKDFMQTPIQDEELLIEDLMQLLKKQLIFSIDDYYTLKNDKKLVIRRLAGNKQAEKHVHKAFKNAKLIGSFPYVRGVGISGSLSKGYMDESGDVDFFIITEPERLWIARTLLILYKKIFLLNSRKYFCVNYFIDTNHLEIQDKNIFTATEILTLIPAYNHNVFKCFIEKNSWAQKHLPNKLPVITNIENASNHFIKSKVEQLLNNKPGSYIDSLFMKLTLKKWKRKFKHIEETDFELAMRTRKYVSKHHPQGFQQKVLLAIEKKTKVFEIEHNLKLS
ncbi:MAG: nucleotidyltransferase domain-containing protein [Bacteroidota bacterium]|jgi:hypothetical protein